MHSTLSASTEARPPRAREDPEFRVLIKCATAGLGSPRALSLKAGAPHLALIISLDRNQGVEPVRRQPPAMKAVAIVPVILLALVALVTNVFQMRNGHGEPARVADASRFVHAGPHLRSDGRFFISAVSLPPSGDAQLSEGVLAMRSARTNAIAAAADCLGHRTNTSDVTISAEGFTGGSGGLMFALTVIDALGRRDLTRGRDIAGTGTIVGNGKVGRVLFVGLKAQAAERAGADLFLVPAAQIVEARRVVRKMRVAGVRSLDEAVRLLVGRPGCSKGDA